MDEVRYAPPKAAVADVGGEPMDVAPQLRRLRWAANACLVFGLIMFYRSGGLHIGSGAIELLFVLAMAAGVYLRSRVCAVLVTLDFAVNVLIWNLVPWNPLFLVACVGVACFLSLGIVAAFQYHHRVGR